jgi:hypothetical protein
MDEKKFIQHLDENFQMDEKVKNKNKNKMMASLDWCRICTLGLERKKGSPY